MWLVKVVACKGGVTCLYFTSVHVGVLCQRRNSYFDIAVFTLEYWPCLRVSHFLSGSQSDVHLGGSFGKIRKSSQCCYSWCYFC